jgi:lipopolysaccharide export LptBFGC system permease protein LptF
MIATPLSLGRVEAADRPGIAFAVLIAFVYWTLVSVGTMISRQCPPPVVSSWLADGVFGLYAGLALIRLHRNS